MRNWKDDAMNVAYIGYAILIICALISVFSCNPVKQVLKDKNKLDKVAEVVIRSGYCANDTTIITKSDTTIVHDTTYDTDTIIDLRFKNDTHYVKVPKVITRTITIRDTIKSVVVDNSRILLLQKEIDSLRIVNDIAKKDAAEWKQLAKKRWWNIFWLIVVMAIYVLRKPIYKFIQVYLGKI